MGRRVEQGAARAAETVLDMDQEEIMKLGLFAEHMAERAPMEVKDALAPLLFSQRQHSSRPPQQATLHLQPDGRDSVRIGRILQELIRKEVEAGTPPQEIARGMRLAFDMKAAEALYAIDVVRRGMGLCAAPRVGA
jgi:hypothetical protein